MSRTSKPKQAAVTSFDGKPLPLNKMSSRLARAASLVFGNRQSVLVRMPLELSEPVFLTNVDVVSSSSERIELSFRDPTGKYRARLTAEAGDQGFRCTMHVTAPGPIWLVEWQTGGLPLEEVIVPALGGQAITPAMPTGRSLAYKYPFWWNAQFVIGRMERGGVWLRTMDKDPLMKLLRVKKEADGFALTIGFEADGPLKAKEIDATWYVDGFDGSWKEPVDIHRAWLEETWELPSLYRNDYFPDWADKVNFVLELWGMRRDQSRPHHTFSEMIGRLKEWKKLHAPDQTLLYLPGFAGHGIDSHAPDYSPSAYLGGPAKFSELVRRAHDLGYHVMIHTNVLAMTFSHPLFAKFKKHQVVDVFDRQQAWGLDMDGDWLAEPFFAYINPGAKAWGDLMGKILGELIEKYHVDAVFLDQTLLAFNVSKGPNFMKGMRAHVERLQRAFPETLFAGEGINDYILPALPMAQIHGIDSIREVHGMEDPGAWRSVHPVSTYLFGKHTRFVAHLLTRHPSDPAFSAQEEAYGELGVIPALALYNNDQPMDTPEVRKMIARAKTIHRKDTK